MSPSPGREDPSVTPEQSVHAAYRSPSPGLSGASDAPGSASSPTNKNGRSRRDHWRLACMLGGLLVAKILFLAGYVAVFHGRPNSSPAAVYDRSMLGVPLEGSPVDP